MDQAGGGDHAWLHQAPPVLVPVPASEVRPLTGARLVIHDPHRRAWSYDWRAGSEPHHLDGTACIGVLTEQEWFWRAADPTMVAVPRPVPLAWAWVEQPLSDPGESEVPDQSAVTHLSGPAARIVDPARPPVRHLRRVLHERRTVTGARAVIMGRDGPWWGYRITSEPFLSDLPWINATDLDTPVLGPVVTATTEEEWHAHRRLGQTPVVRQYPAVQVWVE